MSTNENSNDATNEPIALAADYTAYQRQLWRDVYADADAALARGVCAQLPIPSYLDYIGDGGDEEELEEELHTILSDTCRTMGTEMEAFRNALYPPASPPPRPVTPTTTPLTNIPAVNPLQCAGVTPTGVPCPKQPTSFIGVMVRHGVMESDPYCDECFKNH